MPGGGLMGKTAWNPRPSEGYNCLERTGYLAGYSDGFHGLHYGAGYDDPPAAYRTGFEEGCAAARGKAA
ncbi:hypothetical protein CcrColossus_gp368 [Caulobacter phage CcrColossus]|uniref:Uncharacterized protein n=1 Tax=Caulobacter phage CcrColossus TaxID=1211640 RepID=K4JWF6_9CAUD|nr:hypothetical protein CcrColossus_gp368 [Caulobacter phage CcrColossus]AFU88238.1 hypothetical protein CcrColossus_gp368 [Caulobacter phage CcrColossus]